MEEPETNQIYENLGYTNEKNDVKQSNVLPKDYMTLAIMFNEIFYRIMFTKILISKYLILFLKVLLLAF